MSVCVTRVRSVNTLVKSIMSKKKPAPAKKAPAKAPVAKKPSPEARVRALEQTVEFLIRVIAGKGILSDAQVKHVKVIAGISDESRKTE